MGYATRVSTRPDPEAPGTGRAKPGESRKQLCRYLRGRGNIVERCSAEALDEDADVVLCARHTALVVEHFNAALANLRSA